MTRNKKRLPKPVMIILIIILIIYLIFVFPRLTGRYLSYIPFSGRIFSLTEEKAERSLIFSQVIVPDARWILQTEGRSMRVSAVFAGSCSMRKMRFLL